MAAIGHNSKTTFAQGQLRSLVERIERLEAEKATISADIKEVYSEAKANGFDTKIIRKIISLRKKESAEREEEQAMLDLYMNALGMPADTPLGRAAMAADSKVSVVTKASAKADGFNRGQDGLATDDVAYPEGSPFRAAHMDGWHDGNAVRLGRAMKPEAA